MATPPPRYAQRVARLPQVFELLAGHPDGLPIADLAARFGIPVDELREDLLAFFTADPGALLGLYRPAVLEFLGNEGAAGPDGADEVDPETAEVVRIVDERPADELGVEYVDAAELALVYTAAEALLDLDPSDRDLAEAVDVLVETLFGRAPSRPIAEQAGPEWRDKVLDAFQEAIAGRKRMRIVYSRSWWPGLVERVIEPYRLVRSRRAWEIDAGPPDAHGELRTYLRSGVRSFEVLDETFAPPDDLDGLLDRQRATTTVRLRIPHTARWSTDLYAERAVVVTEDEETVTLDLTLLPPVEHRVALLVLSAGQNAAVLNPPQLSLAVEDVARRLLEHHRATSVN